MADDQKKSTPTKRKPIDEFVSEFKTKFKEETIQRETKLFIKLTASGIELIWSEAYTGQDAFMYSLSKDIEDKTQWTMQHGLFAVVSMRESKSSNNIVRNIRVAKDGTRYPRRYYCRVVDTNLSTKKSRHAFLTTLINELEMKENQQRFIANTNPLAGSSFKSTQAFGTKFILTANFDQTPQVPEPLDHFILDNSVASIIMQLYENVPGYDWSKWATENPTEAYGFFSWPYSNMAKFFGYDEVQGPNLLMQSFDC